MDRRGVPNRHSDRLRIPNGAQRVEPPCMRGAREHPLLLTLMAFALAGGVVVGIAAAYGFAAFADAWSNLHWPWLALALGAAILAIVAYALCYRAAAAVEGGPQLRVILALRAVIRGFAPFAVGGGFAVDKRVLHAIEDDEDAATVRVLGLGALE